MADELEHAPHPNPLKRGKLFFGGGEEHRECIIWHISENCAVFEIATDTAVPDEFRLFSAALAFNQICRVSWRGGQRIGVRLLGGSCARPSIRSPPWRCSRMLSTCGSGWRCVSVRSAQCPSFLQYRPR